MDCRIQLMKDALELLKEKPQKTAGDNETPLKW